MGKERLPGDDRDISMGFIMESSMDLPDRTEESASDNENIRSSGSR